MRECKALPLAALEAYAAPDEARLDAALAAELARMTQKIVVLDDDPTGVQTVHGVSVYTNWTLEALRSGFAEKNRMFFVLTNSRGFTAPQTERAHEEIMANLALVARETGKDFILISRSDSTLRGHYPLETETLRKVYERLTDSEIDGEILCPFFQEGGRYTLGDVHYVREGEKLVPAGQTEFAKDKTFGYAASDLKEWCEEKTGGAHAAASVVSVGLDELRRLDFAAVEAKLREARGFQKIVVNAIGYADVKAFAVAFYRAVRGGKRFLLRSAAAVTKVLGGVSDRPLLAPGELVCAEAGAGGVVLVGSHVKKTTEQLEALRRAQLPLSFMEFNAHLACRPGGLAGEVERVVAWLETELRAGRSAVVYTSRSLLQLATDDKDEILRASVAISDAVTSVIARLGVRPRFLVAKGGITSSDVGTKALRVERAEVLGQVRPGIPVWKTGPESKFPGLSYVIFPGNVGEAETLREVVEILAYKA